MRYQVHNEGLTHTEQGQEGRAGLRFFAADGERLLSMGEVLSSWTHSEEARQCFLEALAAAPYAAFFWEMPAVTTETLQADFECVVLPALALAGVAAARGAFSEYFTDEHSVVDFPNLGGDARLVVPCPRTEDSAYPHLAAFVRGAPAEQQHALLARAAGCVLRRCGERPLWLSTSGLGVYWVHLRLDQRPKYYNHLPYTRSGLASTRR